MDAGEVAEVRLFRLVTSFWRPGYRLSSMLTCQYASPVELFDTPGSIFRSLCDVKGISKQDLSDIRAAAGIA